MSPGRRLTWRAAACALAILALAACGEDTPRLAPLGEDAVILAFGDSLTYGTGARPEESYPAVLARLISRPVIRSGVPGEATAAGLRRLERELARTRPDLLILCHGGNDFLRRTGDDGPAANIRAMIETARAAGAQVVLIGVPKPGLFLTSAASLYEEIATELAIPYDGEILADILDVPRLKSDGIHPNASGYRLMAEAVADLLREAGAI